jgi:putative component of toxin-antitoxin plasmid stabilization module
LLCGGDKSTQHKDIEKAHDLAQQWVADKKAAEKEQP